MSERAEGDDGEPEPEQSSAEEPIDADELPGKPLTRKNRVKSAILWGIVGALAFLVLAQGYLLVGGDFPFRYLGIFPMGAVIGAAAAVVTYLTEHRLRAKRRT